MTDGLIEPRALALSSPAIAPRVSALKEQALRLLVKFAPDLPLNSRIKPEQVTRDPTEQAKIKADERMHTTVTPRLVVSILDQGESALAAANRIRVPTLLLVAGDDRVVDQDVTLKFAAKIQPDLMTLHTYPKLFHEVFNELPPDRKFVFQDFDRWLRCQLGLPFPTIVEAV